MKTVIIWACIITALFAPSVFERCSEAVEYYATLYQVKKSMASNPSYYSEQIIGINCYYFREELFLDDSITLIVEYNSSGIIITNYTYELSDREVKLTLLGRFADPPIDIFLDDMVREIYIPVHRDEYDTVSICDDKMTRRLYEDGVVLDQFGTMPEPIIFQ